MLLFLTSFIFLLTCRAHPDDVLLAVPLIGIALYTLKHIHSMTEAKIARIIRHSYRLPIKHRRVLMWGIVCYVRAAYPQFDEKVFQKMGDKVYGDMLRRNPRLRKEKDMSKQVSFDFEDALAEREGHRH